MYFEINKHVHCYRVVSVRVLFVPYPRITLRRLATVSSTFLTAVLWDQYYRCLTSDATVMVSFKFSIISKQVGVILFELFFCKKISLNRCIGYVMDGWFSERCMYVTPIRLDILLNTNQISCCKGKWYVRRFDPDTVQKAIFILL